MSLSFSRLAEGVYNTLNYTSSHTMADNDILRFNEPSNHNNFFFLRFTCTITVISYMY